MAELRQPDSLVHASPSILCAAAFFVLRHYNAIIKLVSILNHTHCTMIKPIATVPCFLTALKPPIEILKAWIPPPLFCHQSSGFLSSSRSPPPASRFSNFFRATMQQNDSQSARFQWQMRWAWADQNNEHVTHKTHLSVHTLALISPYQSLTYSTHNGTYY